MVGSPTDLPNGPEFVFTDPNYEDLWQKLAQSEPQSIAALAQVQCLDDQRYLVVLLGAPYLFEVEGRRIVGPQNRPAPDKRVALCLLNYLAGTHDLPLAGNLVPETVLPGGERFFSGTHALTRQPILTAYGHDGPSFIAAAQALGAEPMACQSGSYSFKMALLPKIPVQVTLCEADDEFPADLYFAFDAGAANMVPLGIISALIGLLNACLTAKA